MATLNFPDSPDTGDTYTDSNSGFTYEWNGTVWISKDPARAANIRELDNIESSFDGSETEFDLTVNSASVEPANPQQLIVSIGGVMQNPGDDFTVSASKITFTTAPVAGLTFFGIILGQSLSINTISGGTVSPASLTSGGPSWNSSGDVTVSGNLSVTSGITTATTGISSYLIANNLNVGGMGTVANVLMTRDGAGLGATMGAAVGVITYYGDGSNLTGVGETFQAISFSPVQGDELFKEAFGNNLSMGFNAGVAAGNADKEITLRTGSATGTIVQSFGVGSSVTYSGGQAIINPTSDLTNENTYFVVAPEGAVHKVGSASSSPVINTYSFTTAAWFRRMYSCGRNEYGLLGLNDNVDRSSPTQVGTDTDWKDGFIEKQYAWANAAIKTDGTLWTWGSNNDGLQGRNVNPDNMSSPMQVQGSNWSKVMFSKRAGTALKTTGEMWIWGHNAGDGQFGDNGTLPAINYSSPIQLAGTTYADVCLGDNSTAIIKTDGTLWTMGAQQSTGCLGQNSQVHYSSPMQVGTDTTWSSLGSGGGDSEYFFGIKTDGTMWAWGDNTHGGLGLNAVVRISSPTQLPGTTWSFISYASDGEPLCIANKTDNTLWSWGYNNNGQLGHNNKTNQSSPTQIPGTWASGYKKCSAAGLMGGGAINTDGEVFTWGKNDGYGGLGQNNRTEYSSPKQVGAETDWSSIDMGGESGDDLTMRLYTASAT